jgi:hypothetical protein
MAAPPTPPAPWIDGSALWQIVLLALVAGAGLPALFAVGLRALAMPGRGSTTTLDARDGAVTADSGDGAATATSGDRIVGGNPLGMVVAVFCFVVVLAAVGWGIWAIYEAGH